MNIIRLIILITLTIIFSGCTQSSYQKFYNQIYTTQLLAEIKQKSPSRLLKKDAEPRVITGAYKNMDKKIIELKAKGFDHIGYSSFIGSMSDTEGAIKQAQEIGAVLVLLSSGYADSVQNSGYTYVTEKSTTYNDGNINSYGNKLTNYGYSSTASLNTDYSGSSTTYKKKAIPYSYKIDRYDQVADYFIINDYKYKFGTMGSTEISREERIKIGQNGIRINNIRVETPVYNSNILIDDILIKFDGINVKSHKHYSKLCANFDVSKKYSIWTVIRNNKKIDIKINF